MYHSLRASIVLARIIFAYTILYTVIAGMLDHIIVETSGVKMSLSQIAVVSVLDSKTLSINPYDPNVTSLQNRVLILLLPFSSSVNVVNFSGS